MLTLTAATARAQIVPQMGGGLAGLWTDNLPVLRPWNGQADPFTLACNLLVPFSNRISHGGFTDDGHFHPIAANLPGEPYPIHGDGFQRTWSPTVTHRDYAELTLQHGEIGPFLYSAKVSYYLTPHSLIIALAVTNRATTTLPYGLGLHPWFPRDAATRLQFTATGTWPETPDHLPATTQPLPQNGGPWATLAPLPHGWINTGYSGWDGQASISQGPAAATLQLTATNLPTALLYSPSATADFFCFEPVSHPVDAHNLPGQPGLTRLASGETLTATMTLTWAPDP